MVEIWYCRECMELTAGPEMHFVIKKEKEGCDGSQMYPVKNYGLFHAAFQKLVIE